jgi:hypothetical protein
MYPAGRNIVIQAVGRQLRRVVNDDKLVDSSGLFNVRVAIRPE